VGSAGNGRGGAEDELGMSEAGGGGRGSASQVEGSSTSIEGPKGNRRVEPLAKRQS